MKYLHKENLRDCVVVDYADRQFSNFAIEYTRKNDKSSRNHFHLLMRGPGAQGESVKQKNGQKSCDTVPFNSTLV